jgi:hypothetical protein
MNCFGTHASGNRNCPIYRDETAIQELKGKDGLSFLDVWRKFLKTKPKTGTQTCASGLHHTQGVDVITQTRSHSFPDQAEPYYGPILNNSILPD